MYKILTVCGMGWGCSLMLKMNVNDLLKERNIEREYEVVAGDLASVKTEGADVILGTRDMERHLQDVDAKIILLDSLTDKEELETKLFTTLEQLA
jgi:PTS system ascorbate-specific IIB component